MNRTINIKRINVLTGRGADLISIHIEGLTPFPKMGDNEEPILQLKSEKGYGEQWVKEFFEISPEVINY